MDKGPCKAAEDDGAEGFSYRGSNEKNVLSVRMSGGVVSRWKGSCLDRKRVDRDCIIAFKAHNSGHQSSGTNL